MIETLRRIFPYPNEKPMLWLPHIEKDELAESRGTDEQLSPYP